MKNFDLNVKSFDIIECTRKDIFVSSMHYDYRSCIWFTRENKFEHCVRCLSLTYCKNSIRLNFYNAKNIECKALFAIVFIVYVNWCKFLHERDRKEFLNRNLKNEKNAWITIDVDHLEQHCRTFSVESLLNRLWNMYFENESNSFVHFETLSRYLVKFYEFYISLDCIVEQS